MRNPYVFQALPDKMSFRVERKATLALRPRKGGFKHHKRPSLGNCVVSNPILFFFFLSLSSCLYLESKELGWGATPTPHFLSCFPSENHIQTERERDHKILAYYFPFI